MNARHSQIRDLLACYCSETGISLRLSVCDYSREFALCAFLDAGFTKDDLVFLIRHLKRQIAAGKRYPGCLRFSSLLGDLGKFDEELGMARAESRKPVPTPRDKVVQAFRPVVVEQTTNNTQSVGAVSEKAMQILREIKASL